MGKKWGTTRLVRPMTTKEQNLSDFNQRVASGKLDMNYSFIDRQSGAYVAFMKGHNYYDEEMEVARVLAANGINVVLTPEGSGNEMYATNIIIKRDGSKIYKYSEGTLSIYTYEQKTPDHIEKDKDTTVANAIKHANLKRSQIAVLYDRYNLFHSNDIEHGMKYYQSKDKAWEHKAKALIVVNSKGGFFEHQFDK